MVKHQVDECVYVEFGWIYLQMLEGKRNNSITIGSSGSRTTACLSLQRDAGCGQPPTVTPLVSEGYLCPPGQEYDSLEWELAKWLIDNKVLFPRT